MWIGSQLSNHSKHSKHSNFKPIHQNYFRLCTWANKTDCFSGKCVGDKHGLEDISIILCRWWQFTLLIQSIYLLSGIIQDVANELVTPKKYLFNSSYRKKLCSTRASASWNLNPLTWTSLKLVDGKELQ